MKTMYKAIKGVFPEIKEVEVVRTTKNFVVFKYSNGEQRESIRSNYYAYFNTHKEAKEYLINYILSKIAVHNLKIQNLEEQFEKVRVL